MSLSVLLHGYMGIVLYTTNIRSSLTKMLMYQQCALDGLFSVIIVALTNTNNFTPASNKTPVNPILCYALQSAFLPVVVQTMVLCNIVCQSADRLWAIVYPKTYSHHKPYHIILCCTFVPIYSTVSTSLRAASVSNSDGSCKMRPLFVNVYTSTAIEGLLRYGFPICFLIFANILIIRKLSAQRLFTFKGSQNGDSMPSNIISSTAQSDSTSVFLSSVQKSLFLNVFCLAVGQTFIEFTPLLLTILNRYNIVHYNTSSKLRVYHVWTVSLLGNLDPVVGILTVKAIRDTVKHHCNKCSKLVCRNNISS